MLTTRLNNGAKPGGIHRPRLVLRDSPATAHDVLKRGFDLSVAALLLVVAAIAMILVALAVWLHDGGPVIYRHRRVGRGGLAFECLKFRTMARDSDQALATHLARSPAARAEWAATRKLRDDPRILGRLGRFLRRTSLDELPQLFNVLGGDMSLVGPRPIVPEELVRYAGESHWYLAVRPGVTGPWQVGGRSDASYATRVRLDVQYARNPSLRRDFGILLGTARILLSGKGAC